MMGIEALFVYNVCDPLLKLFFYGAGVGQKGVSSGEYAAHTSCCCFLRSRMSKTLSN